MSTPNLNNSQKQFLFIAAIFEDYATRSKTIQYIKGKNVRFGLGPKDRINEVIKETPYMWLEPLTSDIIQSDDEQNYSSVEHTIRVYIADQNFTNEKNLRNAINLTREELMAIIAELSQHPYYVQERMKLIGDITVDTEYSVDDDNLTRSFADLTIRVPFQYTYCSNPVEPIPFYTSDTISYFNSATVSICEIVKACSEASEVTADNGLTKNGNTIELGGTLNRTTIIDGSQTLALYQLTSFQVDSNNIFLQDITGNNILTISNNGVNTNIAGFFSFNLSSTGTAVFTDQRANKVGIEYGGDYTATFVTNSLITKQYADSVVGNVAQPNTQVVFGSGTGLTSNTSFTFTQPFPSLNRIRSTNGSNWLDLGLGRFGILPGVSDNVFSSSGNGVGFVGVNISSGGSQGFGTESLGAGKYLVSYNNSAGNYPGTSITMDMNWILRNYPYSPGDPGEFNIGIQSNKAIFNLIGANGANGTEYGTRLDGSGLRISTANTLHLTNSVAFQVDGKLLYNDGTQANGYVLTSDANGLASWAPSSGGSSLPNYCVIPLTTSTLNACGQTISITGTVSISSLTGSNIRMVMAGTNGTLNYQNDVYYDTSLKDLRVPGVVLAGGNTARSILAFGEADFLGIVNFGLLAGGGTRYVTTDNFGNISATTIPTPLPGQPSGQVVYGNAGTSITSDTGLTWDGNNLQIGTRTNYNSASINASLGAEVGNYQYIVRQDGSEYLQITQYETFQTPYLAGIPDGGAEIAYFGTVGMGIGNYFNTPLKFNTNTLERMSISGTGSITIQSLSASGTRMVVANSNGTLNYQALPTTPNYCLVPLTTSTLVACSGTISVVGNLYGFTTSVVAKRLSLGTTSPILSSNIYIGSDTTGNINFQNIFLETQIKSDVTSSVFGFLSNIGTEATSFNLATLSHFTAGKGVFGSGSTITDQYGFLAGNITGAVNNYGFYGQASAATGVWNAYMSGTAKNYFNGDTGVGTNNPTAKLHLRGVSPNDIFKITNSSSQDVFVANDTSIKINVGVKLNRNTLTTNTTLTDTYGLIYVTGSNPTITLPSLPNSTLDGIVYELKNISFVNDFTLTPSGSNLIDGSNSPIPIKPLGGSPGDWNAVKLSSDGSSWYINYIYLLN